MDSTSGEIRWHLKKETVENQGMHWENLSTFYEATLSPDGEWVAMFMMEVPLRFFIAISLVSDDVISLGDYIIENMYWDDSKIP
jgi:hypothetical protein